jgi:hypothetical protein
MHGSGPTDDSSADTSLSVESEGWTCTELDMDMETALIYSEVAEQLSTLQTKIDEIRSQELPALNMQLAEIRARVRELPPHLQAGLEDFMSLASRSLRAAEENLSAPDVSSVAMPPAETPLPHGQVEWTPPSDPAAQTLAGGLLGFQLAASLSAATTGIRADLPTALCPAGAWDQLDREIERAQRSLPSAMAAGMELLAAHPLPSDATQALREALDSLNVFNQRLATEGAEAPALERGN